MNQFNPNIHHRRSIRLKGYDYAGAGLYFITICCQNRECLFGKIVEANNYSPNSGANNDSPNSGANNDFQNTGANNHFQNTGANNDSPRRDKNSFEMILNDAGNIANDCWIEIPKHFPNVILHEYVIMPNHVHGIIEIVNRSEPPAIGANNYSPNSSEQREIGAKGIGAKNILPQPTKNISPQPTKNISPQPFRSPSKTVGSIVRGYKIGVTKWFRNNKAEHFPPQRKIWQRDYYEHIIRNEQAYNRISEYIRNNPQNWKGDMFTK